MANQESVSKKWLYVFLASACLTAAIITFFAICPPPADSALALFTNGINGNLTSGLWGSLLFLFLTLHLSAGTEKNIALSAEIIQQEKLRLDLKRKIEKFDRFMFNESYHNFEFPDLNNNKQSSGLVYTLEPLKDEHGTPIKKISEMYSLYLVKVRGPANEGVFDEAEIKRYFDSPLKDGRPYFCRFYGNDWYLSEDSGMTTTYRFRFHSKTGQVEYGQMASSFLRVNSVTPDFKLIGKLEVDEDGNPKIGAGSVCIYYFYQNLEGEVFLQVYDSPMKKVYLVEEFGNVEKAFLVIEDIRGHGNENYLKNLHSLVRLKLMELKVTVKVYNRYECSGEQFKYSKILNVENT